MNKVHGFVGVIGSGKNYQQELLVKQGWVAIDFKDELIDMCSDLVGYNIREDYEGFKKRIVGLPGILSEGLAPQHPLAMTGRRLLQRMGTEVMRKRDPDYWVKAWEKKVKAALQAGKDVAVADVRFDNEVQALKSFEFQSFAPIETKIIFCDYYSDRYCSTSEHESEKMAQEFKRRGYQDQEEIEMSCVDPSGHTLCKWRASR